MTAEIKEIFDQQQQAIKDLTEQILLRDDEIAELKTRVTHQPPKEATDEEMNNLYK